MVTNVYTAARGAEEIVKYVRIKNQQSGEEKILERHELFNPDNVEVGDEFAYKVSLLSDRIFYEKDTY